MLLHDSRRDARLDADGARAARGPGPLALGPARDRRRAARSLDARCAPPARPVPAPGGDRRAATPEDETDWPQIAALYGELLALQRRRRSSS